MPKILFCAPQVPTPDRDSGSQRIDDHMRLLQRNGWEVALLAERCVEKRYAERLGEAGIRLWIDPRPSAGHEAFAWDVQAAILCFWKTAERWMPLLRRQSTETRLIVDSIDLHFVRESRGALQQFDGTSSGLLDPEKGLDFIGELNAYAAADAVWTVSEEERRMVSELLGDSRRVFCVPDGEDEFPSGPGCGQRRGMLFVGNFGHPPNRDAALFLCQGILPLLDPALLEKHPLTIAGNAPTEDVRQMASQRGIEVTGRVPSLLDYYRRSLMTLAPLRYGAGTKRKVVQSLMAGTPCVATPVAVEGLGLEDGRHVLVADDASGFAQAVQRLASDPGLWQSLSRRGRERILRNHSRKAVSGKLQAALDAALAQPPRHPDLALNVCRLRRHWIKRQYEQLVERIRFTVSGRLPEDARILVACKGDDDLLQLEGRTARHFPAAADGSYLGHHPVDSAWAIRRLEDEISQGFRFLLLPATSVWWLDHYGDLARYLERRCSLIVDRPDTCRIWQLGGREAEPGSFTQSRKASRNAKSGKKRSNP